MNTTTDNALPTEPRTKTPPHTPTSGFRALLDARPLWQVASLAGLAGAAAAGIYEATLRAAGANLHVGGSPIPAGGFAVFTLMFAAAGLLPALVIGRWAKRPARTYTVVTVTGMVLSLAMPLATSNTAASTRIVLFIAHLAVATVIIPPVAARLPRMR